MGTIRLILAISVVADHVGLPGGIRLMSSDLAVEIFFMISGYYMALILTEKYREGDKIDFKRFIKSRAMKIFVPYWLAAGVSALLLFGGLGSVYQSTDSFWNVFPQEPVFKLLYCFTQLFILGQDLLLFGVGRPQMAKLMLVPQAWSLSLELMFYALAPFLVRRSLGQLVGVMALSALVKYLAIPFLKLDFDPWTYRFFPAELFLFLAGMTARLFPLPIGYDNRKLGFSSLIFLILVSAVQVRFFLPFLFVMGAFFVFIHFAFELTRTWKFDRDLGEYSYHLYLVHFLPAQVLKPLGLDSYLGLKLIGVALFAIGLRKTSDYIWSKFHLR